MTAAIIDQVENEVANLAQAQAVLERLPVFSGLATWKQRLANDPQQSWSGLLWEIICIAYARMALRNGSLSEKPRAYHNEQHLDDLLQRLLYCVEENNAVADNPTGLAILLSFIVAHDLRQTEQANDDNNELIGVNEAASFLEIERLIRQHPESELWNEYNLLLLETMIHASTFGSGGSKSLNFFQGNLAKWLLAKMNLPPRDEELIYLACDIDTANVSLPIFDYAKSAVQVFDELRQHHLPDISARRFFSRQQTAYFFEQQSFHSQAAQFLFVPMKRKNAKFIVQITKTVAKLPPDVDNSTAKNLFLQLSQEYT